MKKHKPITRLTVLAISLSNIHLAYAENISPFSLSPLNLQAPATIQNATLVVPITETRSQTRPITTTTTITKDSVKPNVHLLLDNSLSMYCSADSPLDICGDYQGALSTTAPNTRAKILASTMEKMLNKHGSKGNFGLRWFTPNGAYTQAQPLGTAPSVLIQKINNARMNWNTPTIDAYLDTINDFNGKVANRCQKNYIVIMSDGASEFSQDLQRKYQATNNGYGAGKPGGFDSVWYGNWVWLNKLINDNPIAFAAMKNKYGTVDGNSNQYKSLCGYNSIYSGYQQWCTSLKNKSGGFVYYPYTGGANLNSYSGLRPSSTYSIYSNPYNMPNMTTGVLQGSNNRAPLFNKTYAEAYAGDMLAYIRAALDEYDVRNAGATDASGKSWDSGGFNRKIKTFTIAFGGAVSPTGQAMLRNGATPNIFDKNGNLISFTNATDQAALEKAFDAIFETISAENPPTTGGITENVVPGQPNNAASSDNTTNRGVAAVSESSSYASLAPSVIGGGSENEIANMSATIYLPAGMRSSQLRFYELDAAGNVRKNNNGEAIFDLPDFTNRRALVSHNGNIMWATTPTGLNNATFALPADAQGRTDEWSAALLPWATHTGNDNDIRAKRYRDSEEYYRIRAGEEKDMGDVLDAPVIAIGTQTNKRQEFLVTAANDGMVYLFQNNPTAKAAGQIDYHPYALKLNYLPLSLPRNTDENIATTLKHITHDRYSSDPEFPHKYLLNGGIMVRQTSDERAQQIFMVGNAGQGARGMYVLNVGGQDMATNKNLALSNNNTSQWQSEVPLFEVTGNTEPGLGYTVGTPSIARVRVGTNDVRQMVFLSSGFAYPSKETQETALYVYDALGKNVAAGVMGASMNTSDKPGKRWAKAVVSAKGGLASPTTLDVNLDGIVDYAFAGDYLGNLYRFDLRDIANGMPVKQIYQGNPSQPITSAPAISRQKDGRYVIAFGTGSSMFESDYESKAQQGLFGIYQRFDGDLNPIHPNGGVESAQPLISSDLLQQQLSLITGKQDLRQVSNMPIFASDNKTLTNFGWYIPLGSNDGERVVTTAESIFGTLFFSTRIYKINNIAQTFDESKPFNKSDPESNGWKLIDTKRSEASYRPGTNAGTSDSDWTPWRNIGNPEVTNSTTADACLAGSSTSTQLQQRDRYIDYTETSQYQRIIRKSTSSSGWLLSINATNGGQLTKENVGVDFERTLVNNDSLTADTIFVAGALLEGVPNQAFLLQGRGNAAMNYDGIMRSGVEEPLGEFNPNKDCFKKGTTNLLQPHSSETGVGLSYTLLGRECVEGGYKLRRLSWREIVNE